MPASTESATIDLYSLVSLSLLSHASDRLLGFAIVAIGLLSHTLRLPLVILRHWHFAILSFFSVLT
jgi:hypothetical protein